MPVVDEAIYASMVGSMGDPSIVESVVRMFLDAVPAAVAAMRDATPETRGVARDAAHELKGNAGMMGARALADACGRFEVAAREGAFSDLAGLADEVTDASRAVQSWLEARLTDAE